MDSWEQYWELFDKLCASLDQRGEIAIVESLRDSQRSVNGLTDGWWDFLVRFRSTVKEADKDLLPMERGIIATLDSTLHTALTKR